MTPEAFRRARKQLKLSQSKLATELGMTRNAVYYMERGERPVVHATMLAVEYLLVRQAAQIGAAARQTSESVKQ